jgi:hypothetical protein
MIVYSFNAGHLARLTHHRTYNPSRGEPQGSPRLAHKAVRETSLSSFQPLKAHQG